ncbi:MAG: DUF3822 family protein [Prevotellaceae bacterium]|jgi:hypothetical protein|nr:DUF3822 family protein [Prevotellaceae bacterium]
MQLEFDFVDKKFRITDAENYRLSIQISLNGFSFCVYDAGTDKHLVIKHFSYTKNIRDEDLWMEEIAEISNIIFADFDSSTWCNCLFYTQKNILVPKDVFSESCIKDYMSPLFRIGEYDEINVHYIPEIDSYSCFLMPSRITMELVSRFDSVNFFDQTYCCLREMTKKVYRNKMNVIFCGNFINIILYKDNSLILNNSFEVSNINDVIYFIAAIIRKNEIAKIPIFVSGEISPANIRELGKFFPNLIQEHDRKVMVRLGLETSSRYYSLLMMHKCE